MDQYNLDTEWNLWYHSIVNNDWSKQSYQKLMTIRNLFDYQLLKDTFKQNHFQNGMFFVMKGDIFPTWEDPRNRNGCFLSFKVSSSNLMEEWNELFFRILTNQALTDSHENINGVSISPKKEFNIVKLWFSKKEPSTQEKFKEFGEYFQCSNSIFKEHNI